MNERRNKFITSAGYIKRMGMGYRVFVIGDNELTYGFFSDGKNVGYFQQNECGEGVQLATVNKTPGSTGTGYLLETGGKAIPVNELTKEYMEKAFHDYPDYFSSEDKQFMYCIKYISLDDFLAAHGNELIELIKGN